MSTRAIYTFKDDTYEIHVYKHHDGYPTGAAEFIHKACEKSWELPRFEADEFAASFVAANKDSEGGVRLMQSGNFEDVASFDIEYHYVIYQGSQTQDLRITGYHVSCSYPEGKWDNRLLFDCSIDNLNEEAFKAESKECAE